MLVQVFCIVKSNIKSIKLTTLEEILRMMNNSLGNPHKKPPTYTERETTVKWH